MQSRWIVAEIVALEATYPTEYCIPPHEHCAAFFDLVVAGSCSEEVGGHVRERRPSTLAFHPAGEVHSSRWHGVAPRCFHVEIPLTVLNRVRQYSSFKYQPNRIIDGLPILLATRLYNEFRHRDELSPLVIEGLTLELLAESMRPPYSRPERNSPRWLNSVHDLLRAKFADDLSVQAIAKSVGMHPAHVARVFRQFHGCTLGEYIRRLRIEYACVRLTRSDAPLAEIALAAGFSDQSHFSNSFKRQLGISPAIFRKSHAPRKTCANECSDRARL
jgi:AraC family transcriptional regulator